MKIPNLDSRFINQNIEPLTHEVCIDGESLIQSFFVTVTGAI